jgi:hypothetical protein
MNRVQMTLREALRNEQGVLSQLVITYSQVMKEILDAAKDDPMFSAASWAS